jgi:DNA (cytosine-5)-methyltransferase 1
MTLTAISTFSGGGGSSTGYKHAGFNVLWASEFVPQAAATYRANHRDTILDTRDIRNVKAEEVLSAIGMSAGELDLMDGSPPCSAFSIGGKRQEKWGKVSKYSDTAQRADDLFFEYVRLLEGIQPKVFVAENVPGLVMGAAAGYFKMIHRALEDTGYKVKARIVDASYLGVPQMRRRLIFVGVRNDLPFEPVHPTPQRRRTPLSTVMGPRAKCSIYRPRGWVHYYASGPICTIQSTGLNGRAWGQTCWTGVQMKDVCPESGMSLEIRSKDVRSLGNMPMRHITLREAKLLCGFPEDYILTSDKPYGSQGAYGQRWERLGRAVPPKMMQAIAEAIKENILCAG